MEKITSFFVAAAICFGLAINAFSQSGIAPVYLDVLFDNSNSATSGISSDGGLYSHGYDSVTAQFTENGYLNFLSGARPITAKYPLKQPLGTGDGTGSLAGKTDTKLNVQILTFVSNEPLQNMTVGTYKCEGLGVNISMGDSAQTKRTIGYRAGRGTLGNTGYVKISHPDENTWYIESNTLECNPGFNQIARIRDSKNKGKPAPDVDYGRYLMPLRMILTRR